MVEWCEEACKKDGACERIPEIVILPSGNLFFHLLAMLYMYLAPHSPYIITEYNLNLPKNSYSADRMIANVKLSNHRLFTTKSTDSVLLKLIMESHDISYGKKTVELYDHNHLFKTIKWIL